MRFLKRKIEKAKQLFPYGFETRFYQPPSIQESFNSSLCPNLPKYSTVNIPETQSLSLKKNDSTVSATSCYKSEGSSRSEPKKRTRIPGQCLTSEKSRSTKNIAKNYGRAICSFASSELALPYLAPKLKELNIGMMEFLEFVVKVKEKVESIQSFRDALIAKDKDEETLRRCKAIFIHLAEIFIKFFSVNWIFSGRVAHKDTHLRFRFKMLRRIKNPESFTYIQKSTRGKKSR